MLSFCFFLIIASTSVKSEVININEGTDNILKMINQMIKTYEQTIGTIPDGSISYENETISYSSGSLLGLDSMVRTGDCVVKDDSSALSFDIHFGYSLLTAFFRTIIYEDQYMSAFFRIGDNSLRLAFTVHNGTECHVTLDAINYERMSKVVLGTSVPELDGLDVDAFFQKSVMPAMDKILNSDTASIENSLQFMCKLIPGSKLSEVPGLKGVFQQLTGL
nr:uncharacterized protein LOC106679691 [Halyomorpha halys]